MKSLLFIAFLSFSIILKGSPQQDTTTRFTSISPSALALIELKSNTKIPFAKETADLLLKLGDSVRTRQKIDFGRLIHFENRYWSINDLLEKIPSNNILEFSSGYSFRGLSLCRDQMIHFIDSDLQEVIKLKVQLQDSLIKNDHLALKGDLKTIPLNVFDLDGFRNTVKMFPPGPVVIINEGLLPYFNRDEKIKLCGVIEKVLKDRGGYWITADIYVKDSLRHKNESAEVSNFRKEHKLDENRFESYEDAEALFKSCGLAVVYRNSWVFDKITSLERLGTEKRAALIHRLQNEKPIRQTWCLKVSSP